jgi:hypothetical protein
MVYYTPYIFLENFRMIDLKQALTSRLLGLELIAQQGVIPGQLDTYELEQMIGRIKELKLVLKLLAADSIGAAVMELYNEQLD